MADFVPALFHRVGATPAAIDALAQVVEVWRIAPDEALVPGDPAPSTTDPHAIVVRDAGWHIAHLHPDEARRVLRQATDWPIPETRPVLLQGAAHHVPLKVRLTADAATIAVPSAYLAELEARWPGEGGS